MRSSTAKRAGMLTTGATPSVRGSVSTPVMAEAAQTSALAR